MDTSGDGNQRLPVAALHKSARALPTFSDQLLIQLLVVQGVPVQQHDGVGVLAPTKEDSVGRVQLEDK